MTRIKREESAHMNKTIFFGLVALLIFSASSAQAEYLGRYSKNRYQSDSTSNEFGQYGSPYSSRSINNQFGRYGSQFSSQGVSNQFTTGGPKLYGSDGQFLGNLNSNQFDPNSVSNPFGRYGSKFSSTSINNQFSQYGSPFSNQSANNAFATDAPIIIGSDD